MQQTRSQLLSNRAMINLNLKNYNMCIKDCELAIHYWKKNTKAYYRKCKALASLFKHDLAIDCYEEAKKTLLGYNTQDNTQAEMREKEMDLSVLSDADRKAFAELTKLDEQCRDSLKKKEAERLKLVIAKEKEKQEYADIYSALTSAPYLVTLGAPPGTSSDRKNRAIDSNTSKYFEENDDEEETRRQRKVRAIDYSMRRALHTWSRTIIPS